jgi:hypothetical protein
MSNGNQLSTQLCHAHCAAEVAAEGHCTPQVSLICKDQQQQVKVAGVQYYWSIE